MSTMDNFKKNEQLMERDFINRSERELLQNLIKKIELAADPESKNHKESISSILSKHNVKADEDLIKDLLAWKRSTI
jgi:ribosomal protein S20